MSIGKPYPIQEVFNGLVDSLRTASSLSDYLTGVWDYFAQYQASVETGRITVYVTVDDSESEDPSHSNAGQSITAFLPTRFVITCDTTLEDDADTYNSDTNAPSLLDHEQRVITALQENTLWGVPTYLKGWKIDGIQRDLPVIDGNGDVDPQVRRFEVVLLADVIIERTDSAI